MKILSLLVLATICTATLAQTPAASGKRDGLELLTRVSQHYADAKSYRIDAVEERESHNELHRDWQKMLLHAGEAPGNKFRYEGQSGLGSALSSSDGKQVWNYRFEEHAYTATPVSINDPNERRILVQDEFALNEAEHLRRKLASLAQVYNSATLMPEAQLDLNGRTMSCYVVHVSSDDAKRKRPEYSFEETIWIDKATETVAKSVEHAHTFMIVGGANVPIDTETTTTYPVSELNSPIPDSFFTFAPPADAKLLDHFPDPLNMGASLEGQMVPALKLTAADGKTISTDTLRGKPVVLDFWATWCAPCEKNLEKLATLYQQTKDKDLVFISIDRDEDAVTARSFLAKKGYEWPNVHDDGRITQAVGMSGIPRTILVDRDGKIVYDRSGETGDEKLRVAIANLGPEFASVAPKPTMPPCGNQITAAASH
jgi:thiol-disulfide isomerase/thioredoxin